MKRTCVSALFVLVGMNAVYASTFAGELAPRQPNTSRPLAMASPVISFDEDAATWYAERRVASLDLLAQHGSRQMWSATRTVQVQQSDTFPTDYLGNESRTSPPSRDAGGPANVPPQQMFGPSTTVTQPPVTPAAEPTPAEMHPMATDNVGYGLQSQGKAAPYISGSTIPGCSRTPTRTQRRSCTSGTW